MMDQHEGGASTPMLRAVLVYIQLGQDISHHFRGQWLLHLPNHHKGR